jgi:tagatose 1,6-diphosphate aldolase
MALSPGKIKGMQALSNDRGVIAAAAMDQRGSLQKAISKERGSEATDQDLEEFKGLVSEVLTPHASAILLDPEYGLPASRRRASGCGLLLAYELTGYDATRKGRLPDLLPHESVQRLMAEGADAIKILLYYTPDDDPDINDIKHAFIERIGDECKANDVPFFLEFVTYDPGGGSDKSVEFARKKPERVMGSMREFSQDKYGVDVLKVEVPIIMAFVEGSGDFSGEVAYSRQEAADYFREAAKCAGKPFIYLSAGVSNPVFTETLQLAAEADVPFSGVLCGRATWKDGIPVYAKEGRDAFRRWLETDGVRNIEAVNGSLQAAKPWYSFYGADSAEALNRQAVATA